MNEHVVMGARDLMWMLLRISLLNQVPQLSKCRDVHVHELLLLAGCS